MPIVFCIVLCWSADFEAINKYIKNTLSNFFCYSAEYIYIFTHMWLDKNVKSKTNNICLYIYFLIQLNRVFDFIALLLIFIVLQINIINIITN